MKIFARLLCILAGALALSFLVAICVLIPVGQWYEGNRARSFDDLSDAYALSLVIQAITAVIGGWLGDRLFRKWRRKPSDRT
jgi:hypothetical protein